MSTMPTIPELRVRLTALRDALQERYVERDAVIEGLLAAVLAGEHVLLLGPVGTAKSMLAADVCTRIEGAHFFSALLTAFSTPEELFGPVSLKALEQDVVRRITEGALPTAHIAFLDEIFKASSAILNTLLGLMNERVFHNGTAVERAPLITLVAASNELPEEGELNALSDRFLVRFVVDYIQEDFRFLKMLALDTEVSTTTRLTLEELGALRDYTKTVAIDEHILGDLVELRRRLNTKGIVASDRRYRQALGLLRGFAVVRGRDAVIDDDLATLQHVLWSDPAERDEVRMTLEELFHGHQEDARALLVQATEVQAYAMRAWPDAEMAMRASIEAHTKIKNVLTTAENLLEEATRRGRRTAEVQRIVDELRAIQRAVLEHSLRA